MSTPLSTYSNPVVDRVVTECLTLLSDADVSKDVFGNMRDVVWNGVPRRYTVLITRVSAGRLMVAVTIVNPDGSLIAPVVRDDAARSMREALKEDYLLLNSGCPVAEVDGTIYLTVLDAR